MATAARKASAVSDRPQLSKESTAQLLEFIKNARHSFYRASNLRDSMLLVDRYYNRSYGITEGDVRKRLANMLGKPVQVTDFIVPMVLPHVETATGKLAATFLEGSPMFMAGADPAYEDAALQFNTIVRENSTRTGWDAELIKAFRDGFKYNILGVHCYWDVEHTWAVQNDGSNSATRVEVVWSGNKVDRLDMYNTFWDLRVEPSKVSKEGDFVGFTEILTPSRMKKYTNRLFQLVSPKVTIAALNSKPMHTPLAAESNLYYTPDIVGASHFANKGPVADWGNFFGLSGGQNSSGSVQYADAYYRTTVYARLIPSAYGIPGSDTNHPQIFKLVIINDQVLLEVERMNNAHDLFPVLLSQPMQDGHALQTTSLAENLMDMQDLASNMWNATLASKRRAVADRGIFNPLLVDKKDISNSNPAAKIPVRAAGYHKPLSDAYYPIPYRDEQTPAFMQIATGIERYSYVASGTNPAQQGQFVRGNKTKSEVDDVMEGSGIRERLTTMAIRSTLIVPLRRIVLNNTLQYQTRATYANTEEQKSVEIDPVKLRNATLIFKIGDGFNPLDREMGTEEFAVALQTIQAVPAIGAEYNVGQMFAHLMQLRGADLRPFRKPQAVIMYEQQLAVWQQQAQMALEKGVPFNAPMPQPPNEQQVQQEQVAASEQQAQTLTEMVAAGAKRNGGQQ